MAINKDVNYNLNAKDNVSPKIIEFNKNLGETDKAFERVEQQALLTAKVFEKLASTTQEATQNNQELSKSVGSIDNSQVNKATKSFEIMSKAIKLSAQAFLVFQGKERAIELTNNFALKLSITLDGLSTKLRSLGGLFAKSAMIVDLMSVALKGNVAELALLTVAGTDAMEANDSFNQSILKSITGQMTFTEKMELGSIAMQKYGKALMSTEGIMNKLKGATIATAGYVGEFTSNAAQAFPDVISKIALLVGAFTAVIGIEKIFKPVNEAIFQTSEMALKASWASDKAFSEMAKGTGVVNKLKEAFFRYSSDGLGAASKGLISFKGLLEGSRAVLLSFTNSVKMGGSLLSTFANIVGGAAKHTEIFQKGLAGVTAKAGAFGSIFTSLGTALLNTDSILGKLGGVTLVALGLALGGFIALVYKALDAVGGLIMAIGTGLTEVSLRQIETFASFQEKTFAFNHTIKAFSKSTEEATDSIARWGKYVDLTSKTTGQTTATMQALVAETLSATEAFGLSEEQMQVLIDRTIDLSERAHKPAIDTLTALISAMNGAGQAVIPLGLHINDVAIEHSKLSKEQKELFKTTDDVTKAQIRYSVLMEQAGKATGFATDNTDLYTKGLKMQKNAVETLNAELGKGAEIINGEVVWGLANATQALTEMTKPILPLVGFVQALGGRFLQATGFIAKHLLMIAMLTSSYKALQVLMNKGFETGFFDKTIPFANKSLNQLIGNLAGTNVQLKSLGDVGKSTLGILGNQSLIAIKGMLGLEEGAKITAAVVGQRLVAGLTAAGAAIAGFGKGLLVLAMNPITIKIGLIVGAVYLLYKAFQKLEEETQFFTGLWSELVVWWQETSPAMQVLIDIFKTTGSVLLTTFGAAVKLTAAALAGLLRTVYTVIYGFQEIMSLLPDSIAPSNEALERMRGRLVTLDNAMIKLAGGAFADMTNALVGTTHAFEASGRGISSYVKQLEEAEKKIKGLEESYKKIAEGVTAFTPQMNLAQLEQDSTKAIQIVSKMQEALKEKQAGLSGKMSLLGSSADLQKEISDVINKVKYAEEVLKGVRLKYADDVRKERINGVNLEMTALKNKILTTEAEITAIKLNAAKERRDLLIQAEYQRLLQEKNMLSAEAQSGMSVAQEARMKANQTELTAYQNKLNAEKQLAITSEQQKQLALAQLKSELVQGTGMEGQATQNVEVIQEQNKMAQLNALRQQGLLDEQFYSNASLAIQNATAQKKVEFARQQEQQRISALGLTPEALQKKLAIQQQADLMELERIKMMNQQKLLTEDEFKIALQQHELQSGLNLKQVKEQHLQDEIAQNRAKGDSWAATLKEIELAQQQHGMVMGTLRAMQGSAEFGAINGALGNLSQLRNSESKKEFEIGKKAAIAQATVAMFLGATQAFTALSAIPFVGPALGTAAAAAAVMAGMMNIRQIKNQKFGGGSNSGSPDAPTAQVPTETLTSVTGGQAHDGMDAVPQHMNNKSFLLSGGERIVQPEANKSLTSFLDKVESGEGAFGGTTINITINGNVDSKERVNELATAIISKIRERSERGETIISKKGVA